MPVSRGDDWFTAEVARSLPETGEHHLALTCSPEMLFRDETIGALDHHNGLEYARMLRRAMEIGGFYQVVFISHTPGVWELADRVVELKNGRVRIDRLQA